jgi:hypothetical protein
LRLFGRLCHGAGVGNAEAFPQAQALFLVPPRNDHLRGILPFFSNAFRAQRVNLKANIARGGRIIESRIKRRTNKQTSNASGNRQSAAVNPVTSSTCRAMRRPLSFRENLPCPLAL